MTVAGHASAMHIVPLNEHLIGFYDGRATGLRTVLAGYLAVRHYGSSFGAFVAGSVLFSGHLLVFRGRLFGAFGFEPLRIRIPAVA
jgi:hypothetical protein